jgi:hypothetical protein
MANATFFKKAFYIIFSIALLSLIFNAYLLFKLTNNENTRFAMEEFSSGAVGADMRMDCSLCEMVVNTTYKLLPENATQKTTDSVINKVFEQLPASYRYIADDIIERHYQEYKQYIYEKMPGREIAYRLNYCGN